MALTPTTLKQPIAIRPEHIASCPTTIRVKQHSKSWSGGDFTISTCEGKAGSVTKLFSVHGDFGSLSQRRHFRDSSGLPLFELHRKKSGVTWFVHLPGDKSDAEPIATIATKWSAFKDKFDVHMRNAAAGGEDTVIEVRGQDIWKVKTHVYSNGALVMIAKLTDLLSVYVPGKRPEWELTVAKGLDLSLASIIGVLLATLLKYSNFYILLLDFFHLSLPDQFCKHLMLFLKSLIPPAFFAFSSILFYVAIHLPYRGRLYLSPLLFGSAILSLHTSPYLTWLTGMNVLWALFACVWIQHAAAVLYFDQLRVPQTTSPWLATYKIWNDPQRRMSTGLPPRHKPSISSHSRLCFTFCQLAKITLCWALQLFIIGPLVPLYFNFTAQDFAPSRKVFLRRLLPLHDNHPPITLREIEIRLFLSIYWIWIAYLMLDLCNALLSILFSVILRLDTPNEWQPLFGSPLQAYSIRRFWTKFWHRLTVSCCASSGTQVTRRLMGMTPGCQTEKIFVAFWTFLLSGLCHVIADWQAGEPCHPHDDLLFFVANFMASALELLVVRRLERVKGCRADDDKDIWSVLLKTINAVSGYVWVLGFFFWITPKWQYPKLYTVLTQVQGY
ncbi:hypothetical protein BDV38DRAFT_287429 [Aspergillus pseudotamarii]|uniref:Wax synthase domain-containing protein n=1 Tax=Aspergillus pseudotamarii TaxID=132259 RepID=A0A5N6SHF0_ASPPS|nr:uncharacterized protein BDV38DRAFT_287429 [Aspergillus pseudotamarii]KAE8132833.1 hypothetical protein BDV38DRAFT_287429 [Aspergillus pseudotamarii]